MDKASGQTGMRRYLLPAALAGLGAAMPLDCATLPDARMLVQAWCKAQVRPSGLATRTAQQGFAKAARRGQDRGPALGQYGQVPFVRTFLGAPLITAGLHLPMRLRVQACALPQGRKQPA